MTDQEINIALAELEGIIELDRTPGTEHFSFIPWRLADGIIVSEDELPEQVPDYVNDLNAVHRVEIDAIYVRGGGMVYLSKLSDLVNTSRPYEHNGVSLQRWSASATARQRCEAILRTLNLWEEAPATENNND